MRLDYRGMRSAPDPHAPGPGSARPVFPLSAGVLKVIDDDQIEHIDQFVYRFTKLQDTMHFFRNLRDNEGAARRRDEGFFR